MSDACSIKGAAGALALMLWAGSAAAVEIAYVIGTELNERLCPSTDCPSTNKIYRGQKVEIFEVKDDWARVSDYYPADAERLEFPSIKEDVVARWVARKFLSESPPPPLEQPILDAGLSDARIQGIPNVGEYGLTAADVNLLRRYSANLIKAGVCSGIDYGDKSVNTAGRYYVVCVGESRNRSFSSGDVK